MRYFIHSYIFLPFEDVKEDEILEKTITLFKDTEIYERDLYKGVNHYQ